MYPGFNDKVIKFWGVVKGAESQFEEGVGSLTGRSMGSLGGHLV